MNAHQKKSVENRVLLIEDDVADQEILKRMVQDSVLRAELHVASSGEEALQFMENCAAGGGPGEPDLILLDINMPGLGGIETLRRLRALKNAKTTPIIVLTTSDSDSDILKSYECGANSYITKPISFDDFIRVIRELNEYWFEVAALPPTRHRN